MITFNCLCSISVTKTLKIQRYILFNYSAGGEGGGGWYLWLDLGLKIGTKGIQTIKRPTFDYIRLQNNHKWIIGTPYQLNMLKFDIFLHLYVLFLPFIAKIPRDENLFTGRELGKKNGTS